MGPQNPGAVGVRLAVEGPCRHVTGRSCFGDESSNERHTVEQCLKYWLGVWFVCKSVGFGTWHPFVFPFGNQIMFLLIENPSSEFCGQWSMHANSDILHLLPSGSEEKDRHVAASDKPGSALGPDWHEGLHLKGTKEVWPFPCYTFA